ncbi:hypothetical protein DEM27_22150 [Metarhizobium album]|uniref:DUF4174 domain-containing protein n=1 Tax=Metarhizobium album TaxID=2182425 RepID=A0A2U2DL56_9HYPH|nr:DUF4174 domain-containing protein [Rhizobium album]PWE54023.1 hypothetical protein DEM27_22150 [Rhizobium album]
MLKSLATEILGTSVEPQLAAEALSPLRGVNRVFLIFADVSNATAARQENSVLAERNGLTERDMIVIRVKGSVAQPLFGSAPPLDAEHLRQAFNVLDGEFRAVLIGKDGTTKMEVREPISAGELFVLIDAMPIRRQESRS